MTTKPAEFPYKLSRDPIHDTVPFDGANFKTTLWPVPEDQEVKGRIIFLHGFSDYHKTYAKFYDLISLQGYEVFTFDQRGSGETSPGNLKGITNEFHVFNDLDYFIEQNLKELAAKGTKIYLGGHSMGGGIVLNYGIHGKHRADIAGIFCTGPLILLDAKTRPSALKFSALKLLLTFIPNFRIDTDLVPEYLTSDDTWRKFMTTDPIINPLISSLRQGHDFIVRGEKLVKKDHATKFKKDLPVLIIHGKDDKINQPESSIKFYDLIKNVVDDAQLELIDNARHTLFCETEPIYQQTEKIILEWLTKH